MSSESIAPVSHFDRGDAMDASTPLRTPDGRYIVVRGRLWRSTNPHLAPAERARLTVLLMAARRQLRGQSTPEARAAARAAVNVAKVGLGERGPVWWSDGAPDMNRRMARNTPYSGWFAALTTKHTNSRDDEPATTHGR